MTDPHPGHGMTSAILRSDGVHVAVRRLDDPSNSTQLSPLEGALASATVSERRRREIQAGRAAAHAALSAAGVDPAPDVLSCTGAGPLLVPQNGRYLSIAHDGGLAVAACATYPVGIDFVSFRRRPQVDRVVWSAIHQGYAKSLRGQSAIWPSSLLLWTAWEALGKRRGDGVWGGAMSESISIVEEGEPLISIGGTGHLRWWGDGEGLFCLSTLRPPA